MKKALCYLTHSLIILAVQVLSSYTILAFETKAQGLIPRIEILMSGMTKTIEINQNEKFPQDFGHFIILAIGYGPLSITLINTETEEGSLVLTGTGRQLMDNPEVKAAYFGV